MITHWLIIIRLIYRIPPISPIVVILTATFPLAPGANAAESGAIHGIVKFDGTPPVMPNLRIGTDSFCANAYRNNPPVRQDVIVNNNGTLKNVVVYLKQGLPAKASYPITRQPIVLNQKACMYEPHVVALRASQELQIRNFDATVHNANAQPKANPRFNHMLLNSEAAPITKIFEYPELPVRIKCDVHPWMVAFAAVFDHPYFAVTGDDGAFEITGLPPGEYILATWHEHYREQEQEINIRPNEKAQTVFTFTPQSR